MTQQTADHGDWRLRGPAGHDARTVAGWSSSVTEAQRWVSDPTHPFPAATVASWWRQSDVQPWVLVDDSNEPVAYGEVWDDAEEDEVELARLIVDPRRRRQGVGALLLDRLLDRARENKRTDCFLRVAPDNAAALALYRTYGFRDVEVAQAAAWNEHQPTAYVWLQQRLGPGINPHHPVS